MASLKEISVSQSKAIEELQKQRLVDMAWRMFESYSSPEMTEARQIFSEIEGTFSNSEEYRKKYHDKPDNEEAKKKDKKVRMRVRYFHQAGLLLKRGLVDRDLLFGLIGAGFKQDYKKLKMIVDSSWGAHQDTQIYQCFNSLWEQYEEWEKTGRPSQDEDVVSS